jgi:Protein of unknown function (DUF3551)
MTEIIYAPRCYLVLPVDDPGRRNGGTIMVRTSMRLMLASAVFAATMCFAAPASRAFGDAPWCAVINLGTGDAYWDCQYRTVEECVPNVLAGNRGFCNLNPDWRGSYVPNPAAHPRQRKRHVRRY